MRINVQNFTGRFKYAYEFKDNCIQGLILEKWAFERKYKEK